jgi:hypothetical protein
MRDVRDLKGFKGNVGFETTYLHLKAYGFVILCTPLQPIPRKVAQDHNFSDFKGLHFFQKFHDQPKFPRRRDF